MISKKLALGLDPRVEDRFPAFAQPASGGEAGSEKIMREENARG